MNKIAIKRIMGVKCILNTLIFLVAVFFIAILFGFIYFEHKDKKILSMNGVMLTHEELEKYALMLSSKHVITYKSSLKTYPKNRVKENFKFISDVFNILNSHINMGISIEPSRRMALR